MQKKFLIAALVLISCLLVPPSQIFAWTAADAPVSYTSLQSGFTFSYPYQMDFDSAGNLYVTGGTNANPIRKYDSAGNFLTEFGTDFSGSTGLAIAANGDVLATNDQTDELDRFDSSGNFIATYFSSGSGNNQVSFPYALAVDSAGNVYLADASNNRIQKYDSSLTYLATITGNSGAFNFPEVVAVDPTDNVYVADSGNNRVQKFDSSGVHQLTITGNGSAWNYPEGMTVDSSGNLYVADSGNNRIQIFDSTGTFQQEITSAGGLGSFNYIAGLLMSTSGSLYVGDNSRIVLINFDRLPASVSIDSLAGDTTTDTTPALTGTATDALTALTAVEFSIDSGAYSACTADDGTFDELAEDYTCTVSSDLTVGSHDVDVRATDSKTNTNSGATLASYTFSVTALAPTATPSPTPTTAPSNNNQGESTPASNQSSSVAPVCGDSSPASAPELFQADVMGDSVKLFFTPLSDTNNYFISYSTAPDAQEHGVQVSLAREGVQNFTVNLLKPKTQYYFKVRGQNGCMAGQWSNILMVQTGNSSATNTEPFYKSGPFKVILNLSKKLQGPVKTLLEPAPIALPEEPVADPDQLIADPISAPTTPPAAPQKRCFLWWCF